MFAYASPLSVAEKGILGKPYPVLRSAFIGLVTTSEDLRNLGIQLISWDFALLSIVLFECLGFSILKTIFHPYLLLFVVGCMWLGVHGR